MMPPLTREQQIELMKSADVRIETRVRSWIKQPQVREALRVRQNDKKEPDLYSVTLTPMRRSA